MLTIKALNSGSLHTSVHEVSGAGQQTLRVTKGHPIMTPDDPLRASDLIEGQQTSIRDSFTGEFVFANVMFISNEETVEKVWNLKTEDDNYFVNGIMVLMK